MDAILPGLSKMLNYHPVFVHFPIAFWLGALLFELLAMARAREEFHSTAVWLLYLGTLAAVPAAGTGLLAEEAAAEGAAHEIADAHKLFMMGSTSLAVGLCMLAGFRRKSFTPGLRKLFLVGLLALAVLVGLGADRGAQLVYQYGTAVDWSTAAPRK